VVLGDARPFYARLIADKARLKIFALPVLLAAAACVAGLFFPDHLIAYFRYALPVAVVAITVFSYGFMVTRQALREQRAVNQRLSGLQEQYAVAEGLAVMGSWVYDLPEDRFYWSEGSYRVFGLRRDKGPPSLRKFHGGIHPEDRERWQAAHRRGLKDGLEVRLEYRFVKYGNEQVWIRSVAQPESDERGHIVRLAGIAQDITRMRAMAQQLAESEAKFRDLTQLSSDWVWETDAQDRLTFLSESVVSELGAWAKQSIGQHLWDANLIALPRANWDGLKADLAARRQFENFQYSLLDPAGHLYSIAISGRPNIDGTGANMGYRGVGRNVTRETQHQLLLELESEMATVMREHNEPERVVAAIIIAVSRMMSWSGGAHLAQIPGTTSLTVRERWGPPAIVAMLGNLPRQIPITPESVEAKAWKGQAIWMHDLTLHPAFARRYQAPAIDIRAAFLAPIRTSTRTSSPRCCSSRRRAFARIRSCRRLRTSFRGRFRCTSSARQPRSGCCTLRCTTPSRDCPTVSTSRSSCNCALPRGNPRASSMSTWTASR
jgi:PAS domain-containing protein